MKNSGNDNTQITAVVKLGLWLIFIAVLLIISRFGGSQNSTNNNLNNDISKEAAYIYYLMNKGYYYTEKTIKKDKVTDEDEEGRVVVYDSANLSTGIGLQVLKAVKLRDEGKSAAEIKEYLENGYSEEEIIYALDASSPVSSLQESIGNDDNSATIEEMTASDTNEIETAYSKSLANEYRFTSLFQMIGYTYTGLFPNLLKDEKKIKLETKPAAEYEPFYILFYSAEKEEFTEFKIVKEEKNSDERTILFETTKLMYNYPNTVRKITQSPK